MPRGAENAEIPAPLKPAALLDKTLEIIKGQTPIVDLCGHLNIDELKALISKMSAFISVDTGPIYIAEAFGVSTIDIVGPMDENEQPSRGPRHKVVVGERLKPELHIMNARVYDETEARRQIDSITVDMVMRAFRELFPH